MDLKASLLLAIFVVGIVVLVGFVCTKTKGFGCFATSSFLLLVVVVTALLFVAGKLEAQVVANIFFAVIGFAGGLFTGRDSAGQQVATDGSTAGPRRV
jgi:hypothetical protein